VVPFVGGIAMLSVSAVTWVDYGTKRDVEGKTKAKNIHRETEFNCGVGVGVTDDYHCGLGQDARPSI
jgi:hypothetical protein